MEEPTNTSGASYPARDDDYSPEAIARAEAADDDQGTTVLPANVRYDGRTTGRDEFEDILRVVRGVDLPDQMWWQLAGVASTAAKRHGNYRYQSGFAHGADHARRELLGALLAPDNVEAALRVLPREADGRLAQAALDLLNALVDIAEPATRLRQPDPTRVELTVDEPAEEQIEKIALAIRAGAEFPLSPEEWAATLYDIGIRAVDLRSSDDGEPV